MQCYGARQGEMFAELKKRSSRFGGSGIVTRRPYCGAMLIGEELPPEAQFNDKAEPVCL